MATRLQIRLFKGMGKDRFRRASEEVIRSRGGEIHWDQEPADWQERLRTSHRDEVHAVFSPRWVGGDFLLWKKVGETLNCPWMEVRLQESTLWDYTLYRGPDTLDCFSTFPEYWENDPDFLEKWKGKPSVLAEVWEIPLEQIRDYVRHWGCRYLDDESFGTVLRGKAYPTDRHEYSDPWQISDFVEALGAHYPSDDSPHTSSHRLVRPPSND